MKIWMAANKQCSQFLCEGNVNDGLSYHLGYPHNGRYLMDRFVFRDRKFEIVEDCRKWNNELKERGHHDGKVFPIRVNITWEVADEHSSAR